MRFRVHERRVGESIPKLPLMAFVDVALFILLYFLMAGTLAASQSELSATLRTEGGAGGRSADFVPQIVDVMVVGGRLVYRVGPRELGSRAELGKVVAQLPHEPGIVVRVAGNAPVGAAMAAVQTCKDAGFTRVSYLPGN